MAIFKYKALKNDGSVLEDVLESDSLVEAENKLREKSYTILSIKQKKYYNSFLNKLFLSDHILHFFEYLTILIEQKIGLIDSLEIVESIIQNSSFKNIIGRVINDIRQGSTFSSALCKFENIFDVFIIQSLSCSEKTGDLLLSCKSITEFLSTKTSFKEKLKKTLMYPISLISITTLLLILNLRYLIPSIKDFIIENGNITINQKIIFFISDKFENNLFSTLMIFFTFLIVVFFVIKLKSKNTNFYKKYNLILWLQMFSSLLKAGLPLKEALLISKQNFIKIEKDLKRIEELLTNGLPFHKTLNTINKILPSILNFSKIGESSGELGNMLYQCFKFEKEIFYKKIENIISKLQPVLILTSGVLILWIIVSTLLPIYNSMPNF